MNPPPSPPAFSLSHRKPSASLTGVIEHYWLVSWDLRDREPHIQETLPHPNIHVVFEQGNSHAFGVVTSKFTRCIEGKSHAFGVRFAPAMFRAYMGSRVSGLTDRTKPVQAIFGDEVVALDRILTSGASEEECVAAADRFFGSRLHGLDPNAELAKEVVGQARVRRELLTVAHLCEQAGLNKRTLQRLFSEYVGVSPKWVIRRYRLQEAVETLRSGASVNFTDLALCLGYFDQSHLINDFRAVLGYTPTEFRTLHRSQPLS